MSYSPSQAVAWARAHPDRSLLGVPPNDDGGYSWDQWCDALMWWVLGPGTRDFLTAKASYEASSPQPWAGSGALPYAAFVWWPIGSAWHVALHVGNGMVLMASRRVTESFGDAIGLVHVDDYSRAIGMQPAGWSMQHGPDRMNTAGLAGGGVTIIMSWDTTAETTAENYWEGFRPGGKPGIQRPTMLTWLRDTGQRMEWLFRVIILGEHPEVRDRAFWGVTRKTTDQNLNPKYRVKGGTPIDVDLGTWQVHTGERVERILSSDSEGLPAVLAAIGKLGAPTVTIKADPSVFVAALQDPSVAAALAPAIAREVVLELGAAVTKGAGS